jgi:DNA helicase-2/ATP-dependent DNA helicase PcrA
MPESGKKSYKLKVAPQSGERHFAIDYAAELNPQQLAAVQAGDGATLVIAGAGTGKTRVLTYRVAWLIENGIPPEEILLLTFSRKAAQEMMRRAAGLLDDRCQRVQGGTFHGFANRMLRRYGGVLGVEPNFTILDRGDLEDAIQFVRNKLGFGEAEKRFPKKGTLAAIFSRCVNTGLSFRKVLDEEYPQYLELEDEIKRVADAVAEYKKARGLLDYDDLLVRLRELVTRDEKTTEFIGRGHRYLMVDEMQDTNRLQMDILRALAKPHGNILAVGDDFQSIYSFRGAEIRNMMDFSDAFPGARIVKVEENYRSSRPILDFTNRIIESAPEKYEKKLFSSIENPQKPVLLSPASEMHQSAFVCQRVLELREEGVPLERMAVLFRTGFHSNDLELALTRARIPFRKFGGFKFIETSHVKDVFAHLRIVVNAFDAISWNRALLLIQGVGPAAANRLVESIVEKRSGIAALRDGALSKKKYASDLRALADFVEKAGGEHVSASEAMEMALKYAEPILKEHYDDWRKRRDDLQSLALVSERYGKLGDFLADMTLDPPGEDLVEEDGSDKEDEYLTLSTIHSAKGLEWQTVFVLSLVEGYLPSAQSLSSDKQVEEERRLFYVAATRAERNLYLLAPQLDPPARFWGNPDFQAGHGPSRFLKEIREVEDCTEIWTLE